MTKEELIFYCNTAWPIYTLDNGEKWPLNSSLNYYTIIQLELFCQRSEKWNEIPYLQMFMSLHNKNLAKKKKGGREWNLITQRRELASK